MELHESLETAITNARKHMLGGDQIRPILFYRPDKNIFDCDLFNAVTFNGANLINRSIVVLCVVDRDGISILADTTEWQPLASMFAGISLYYTPLYPPVPLSVLLRTLVSAFDPVKEKIN